MDKEAASMSVLVDCLGSPVSPSPFEGAGQSAHAPKRRDAGPLLACPSCGRPLFSNNAELSCSDCQRKFTFDNGIVQFTKPSKYDEAEVSSEEMRRCLEFMNDRGFSNGLRCFID